MTSRCIGAGVLPVAYRQTDGAAYYLLGQEAFGEDAGKWSDFGGRPTLQEKVMQTACREASEESKGVLGTAEEIKEMLQRNSTRFFKVPKTNGAYYAFYLYELPEEAMNCSKTNACACHPCRFSAIDSSGMDGSYREKSALAWLKANVIFEAIIGGSNIVFGDKNYPLRPVFVQEIQALPQYRSYIERKTCAHNPAERQARTQNALLRQNPFAALSDLIEELASLT